MGIVKLHKYDNGFFYDVQPEINIEKCKHMDKNHKMMQLYKALLIDTPYMWKMYKGIRKRKMENVKIYPCKKSTAYSKTFVFYHI
jgi:hypothetical protein